MLGLTIENNTQNVYLGSSHYQSSTRQKEENFGVNYVSDLQNYPTYDEDDLDNPLPYEFKPGQDTTL